MDPIELFMAKSGGDDVIVFAVVILIMIVSSLVKWLRAKRAEGEIKERSVRRGDHSEGAQVEAQRVDGLASLLKALSDSAKTQQEPGSADEDDAWREVEAQEGSAKHEVAREVWNVKTETVERGASTMDPHTVDLQEQRRREQRQRERERRREASAAAERRIAEEQRRAREAIEATREAREATASQAYAASDVGAEGMLEEESRRRAAALEGAVAGRASALDAPSDLTGASREAVRRGMVWSFVLGAPRGIVPYGREATGSVPGLKL